jgi:hypothetical protein
MDDEDYRFLLVFAKEEWEGGSKKVRALLYLGRVMLAIEKYKKDAEGMSIGDWEYSEH